MTGGRRDTRVRREAAVHEDAVRREPLALVPQAALAPGALSAREVGGDDDAVTRLQRVDAVAHLGHDAGELMPEHDPDRGRVPGRHAEDLEVAAADPARLHVEHDVLLALDAR